MILLLTTFTKTSLFTIEPLEIANKLIITKTQIEFTHINYNYFQTVFFLVILTVLKN